MYILGTDTYVVFGKIRGDNMTSRMQANAAQQFVARAATTPAPAAAIIPSLTEIVDWEDDASVDADVELDVDETDMEAKDIELVMQQAGVSRAAAVKALRARDGDMINAIMELSM